MGRVREEKRREERKKEDQRRESQKQEDTGVRKGRKATKHFVFQMICGSGGSKNRLAKAADAEPCGQMRHETVASRFAKSIQKPKVFKTDGIGQFRTFRRRFARLAPRILHLATGGSSSSYDHHSSTHSTLQYCIIVRHRTPRVTPHLPHPPRRSHKLQHAAANTPLLQNIALRELHHTTLQ